eukprot:633525-Prymnesium_polylepis.1
MRTDDCRFLTTPPITLYPPPVVLTLTWVMWHSLSIVTLLVNWSTPPLCEQGSASVKASVATT